MKRQISISLFFILFSFGLRAQEIQLDTLINLEFEGVTLKQALHEISQQYSIQFSYSDSNIPVNNTIRASYASANLGDILRDLLHSNEISYSIIENQIVLFPFNTNQPITVQGKIIDEKDGSPIPFAHISISGANTGTSSNEDGEFEINLSKLPTELLVSHLAHEKKLLYVYNELQELEIKLTPSHVTLKEVTIKAKRNLNSNYKLVQKAYNLLNKSESEIKYGKAFYRQKSSREEKYTEIFELFYDVEYNTNGIKDWAVQEGRYAFQNKNEYDIFLYNKNFTLLSRLFSIRQPDTESYLFPINTDVKKLFDLELKEIIKFDQRFIAVISYAPKSNVTIPAAKGELYIDIDTYQVLEIKGTFTDASLDIIGFNDENSNWDNYQLDFQISFIDDHSDQLLMDNIQINHSFDYYFKKEHIGKINSSSLLTFYEHYVPVKNKKLGGPINYKTSDMKMIDRIGYNADFWMRNPIVMRTPLEEKLILDFEQNESFGAVFMNKNEEVVLLPNKKNNEKALQIISSFESNYTEPGSQCLFLRIDKDNYVNGESLRFAAYVLNRWTLKSFVPGSVLTVEIYNGQKQLTVSKKFDIKDGNVYGEINLSGALLPGKYFLKAHTNIHSAQSFEKEINIDFRPLNALRSSLVYNDIDEQNLVVEFYPESGIILQGVKTKVVYSVRTKDGRPVSSNWQIVDSLGAILQTTLSNHIGFGTFNIPAESNHSYFLKAHDPISKNKWMIPRSKKSGVTMKFKQERARSIRIEMYQKPKLLNGVYLLSTAQGKVFNIQEKRLDGLRTKVDLPIQHLPGGINTLIAMDQTGNILCQRSFFVNPNELNIQLLSASWKSKRSNRVEMKFRVSNQDGMPVDANLTAVCSASQQLGPEAGDIRNHLFFDGSAPLGKIDLNLENDSILSLIDDLMIVFPENNYRDPITANKKNDPSRLFAQNNPLEEPVTAEITVSGNFTATKSSGSNKSIHDNNKPDSENQVYWNPSLEIDDRGIATIVYRIKSKGEKIFVNIQGISGNGLIGSQNFSIDPHTIKNGKKVDRNNKKMFNN